MLFRDETGPFTAQEIKTRWEQCPSLLKRLHPRLNELFSSNQPPTNEEIILAFEIDTQHTGEKVYFKQPMFKFDAAYGLPPEMAKKMRAEAEFEKFREFKALKNLDEIFLEWDCKTGKTSEVKFIKPDNLAGWQSTIYRCATMVKVLKTINQHMAANLNQYNFLCESKTFFRNTTYSFQYDPTNFLFIIKTGHGSGGQVDRNTPTLIYDYALKQLDELVRIMKSELPQMHFEKIFSLYVLIKDKEVAMY